MIVLLKEDIQRSYFPKTLFIFVLYIVYQFLLIYDEKEKKKNKTLQCFNLKACIKIFLMMILNLIELKISILLKISIHFLF